MSKFKLPKLPKRVKAKWVKALRSGDYVQADGTLYKGESEEGKHMCCCLGVLENVCGTPLEKLKGQGFTSDLKEPKSPNVLRKEIDDEHVYQNKLENIFGYMNDTSRGIQSNPIAGRTYTKKSFNEIAAYIERYM